MCGLNSGPRDQITVSTDCDSPVGTPKVVFTLKGFDM